MTSLFLWRINTHLLTLDIEPLIDQNMGITTAQLGEPMNFIGITDINMSEELLGGAEMNQRQLHHQSLPLPV